MDIEAKNTEQSTYNEAINQLRRLDRLYTLAHEYARKGYDAKWRDALDCIWRELSIDAIRLGGGETFDIGEMRKDNPYYRKMFSLDEDIKAAVDRGELRSLLGEKEMFLRFLQDRSGKGGRYEDPEDERDMMG